MFNKKYLNLLQDGDFIRIQSRVSDLELEIQKVKAMIISLRGFINKKLDYPDSEKKETNKSPDGLDNLRY